jgi:CO/xanthine dehydrogenase FAD-binding subunit
MTVVAYHRPDTLIEALAKLTEPTSIPRVLLAGGTTVNADQSRAPVEVVDLQALPLRQIEAGGGRLYMGAIATIQELADHPATPALIAALARREAPSALRNMATIGGTVAVGDSESELLAALLVHEAEVIFVSKAGRGQTSLQAFLAAPPSRAIITSVSITTSGEAAADRTGRTPGDRPIVAAVARRTPEGRTLLALCGVGATPILADDPAALNPPGDFRGSSEYRRHLAVILSERVRKNVSS